MSVTLLGLQAQRAELDRQIRRAEKAARAAALKEAVALVAAFSITEEELLEAPKTWDGVGDPPGWFRDALVDGYTTYQMELVQAPVPLNKPVPLAKARPAEGVQALGAPTARPGLRFPSKGKRPRRESKVLYRHPDTGQTWLGWGQKPAWLKDALAVGAKLDSFLVK